MGVVVTLLPVADDRLRLTFDDVSPLMMVDVEAWKREGLFTHRDFDASALSALNLSQAQFAEIGENLLMRLLATNSLFQDEDDGAI
jgi:hypothetical protein